MSQFLEKYVEGAVNTESRDFQAIGARLADPKTFTLFAELLSQIVVFANRVDALKKHAFYGKDASAVIHGVRNFDLDTLDRATQPYMLRLLHGMFGMFTEAGEIAEHLKAVIFNGEKIDPVNLSEEQGDGMWYHAIFADVLRDISDIDFTECLTRNHDKLAARYPDKFTTEHALNRDLDKEREILEGGGDE